MCVCVLVCIYVYKCTIMLICMYKNQVTFVKSNKHHCMPFYETKKWTLISVLDIFDQELTKFYVPVNMLMYACVCLSICPFIHMGSLSGHKCEGPKQASIKICIQLFSEKKKQQHLNCYILHEISRKRLI